MRKKQFQLLGAAAIFLASKLIEPSPVSALTLVKYTEDTYDREELLVSRKSSSRSDCHALLTANRTTFRFGSFLRLGII